MGIANINALTRTGYYPSPSPGTVQSGAIRRADNPPVDTQLVARAAHQPAEYVVQGELLQKQRNTSSNNDGYTLLDAMRNMDRVLRQNASSTDAGTTASRDTRRAIASYTAESMMPNTRSGSTAAAYIDYYV
jgi:hypothetical protein